MILITGETDRRVFNFWRVPYYGMIIKIHSAGQGKFGLLVPLAKLLVLTELFTQNI